MTFSWNVHFINAYFYWFWLVFFSQIGFDGFQSHQFWFLEGKFYWFFMIVDYFIENFFHFCQTESTHKTQRPSLKSYNRWNACFELLSCIQNGSISSNSDDIVDLHMVLSRYELDARKGGMHFHHFFLSSTICEVENWVNSFADDYYCV